MSPGGAGEGHAGSQGGDSKGCFPAQLWRETASRQVSLFLRSVAFSKRCVFSCHPCHPGQRVEALGVVATEGCEGTEERSADFSNGAAAVFSHGGPALPTTQRLLRPPAPAH